MIERRKIPLSFKGMGGQNPRPRPPSPHVYGANERESVLRAASAAAATKTIMVGERLNKGSAICAAAALNLCLIRCPREPYRR